MIKSKFALQSLLIGIFIMFGLSACQIPTKPTVVTKVVSVYKPIPTALVTNCTVPAPISIPDYLKLSCTGKEDVMTKYTNDLLISIQQCNNNINDIRTFDLNNQKLYPVDLTQ